MGKMNRLVKTGSMNAASTDKADPVSLGRWGTKLSQGMSFRLNSICSTKYS